MQKEKATINKITEDKYIEKLNTLKKKFGIDTYENIDDIIKILYDNNYVDGTIKMFLCSIIWKLKQADVVNVVSLDKYRKKVKELQIKYQKFVEKNKLNEKQKEKYMKWSDIENIYEKIEKTGSLKEKLIIGLYVLTPPRRLEYVDMYIANKKPTQIDNNKNYYINTKKGYFLFVTYKTAKTYGIKKISIPKKLDELIKLWIKENNLNDADKLFHIEKNYNLTKFIKRTFKKYGGNKISIQLLRHSYISDYELNRTNKTKKQRTILAEKMAHNVMQQLDYVKNDG